MMINVNVIGAGRWGPNLIRGFYNLPNVCVRMVCDRDERRLELVRRRFHELETTTDVERALTDPDADAVVIATPVRSHFDLARKALEAGQHVLVEKPLCPDVEQCETLQSMADARGRVLAVGHVFLFNAGIRRVREYIQSGELGRIYYIHASRTNLGPVRDDVNALWDLASHDLSIFQYWLGTTPQEVSAHGECYLGHEVEDVMVGSFRYPGGVLACIHASWLNPRKVREITVVGDRKMVVWNDMDVMEPVRLYDKSVKTRHESEYSDTFGSFQTTIRDGDVIIAKIAGGEPLAEQCAHFIECIKDGRKPINDAASATDVVRALAASDRSLKEGRMAKIESPLEA